MGMKSVSAKCWAAADGDEGVETQDSQVVLSSLGWQPARDCGGQTSSRTHVAGHGRLHTQHKVSALTDVAQGWMGGTAHTGISVGSRGCVLTKLECRVQRRG